MYPISIVFSNASPHRISSVEKKLTYPVVAFGAESNANSFTVKPPSSHWLSRLKLIWIRIKSWLKGVWNALKGTPLPNLTQFHRELKSLNEAFLAKHPQKDNLKKEVQQSVLECLKTWNQDLEVIRQAQSPQEMEQKKKAFLNGALDAFDKLLPNYPHLKEDVDLMKASKRLYKTFISEIQYKNPNHKWSEDFYEAWANWSIEAMTHPRPEVVKLGYELQLEFGIPKKEVDALMRNIKKHQNPDEKALRPIREELARLTYLVSKL